jgi:hypothetical protein
MGEISGSNENINFYKLIAKAEKADTEKRQAICKVVKRGDEYVTDKFLSGISGFITKAEVKEFVWEEKRQKKFVLQLTDSSGICQLEFTPTGAAAGIINCLIDADFTQEISIEAWVTKPNDKNKQFVNACAKCLGADDSIAWAIELKDLPKPVEFTKPSGEKDFDSTNVRNFWIQKFTENIIPKAKKSNFAGTIAAKPAVTEQQASFEAQAPAPPSASAEEQAPISGGIGDSRPLSEIAGGAANDFDLPFVIALLLSIGTLIPF